MSDKTFPLTVDAAAIQRVPRKYEVYATTDGGWAVADSKTLMVASLHNDPAEAQRACDERNKAPRSEA